MDSGSYSEMFACPNIPDGEESPTFLKDCFDAVHNGDGEPRFACVDGDESQCLMKACCDYSNLYTSDSSITEEVM